MHASDRMCEDVRIAEVADLNVLPDEREMLKYRLLLGSPFPVAALVLAVATPGLREQILRPRRQCRTSSSDPHGTRTGFAHLDTGVSSRCASAERRATSSWSKSNHRPSGKQARAFVSCKRHENDTDDQPKQSILIRTEYVIPPRYEVSHSLSAHAGMTAEIKAHVVAVRDFWQVREERGWKR